MYKHTVFFFLTDAVKTFMLLLNYCALVTYILSNMIYL